MIKIGDHVSALNEPIDGIVVSIQGKEIWIETNEEFQFRFKRNELVLRPKEEIDQLLKSNVFFKDDCTRPKVRKHKAQLEVDLHYHGKFVLPKDILSYQLKQFKTAINLAIKANQPEITFIHGVGEGILKTEIEKILEKYKLSFYESPKAKYGKNAALEIQLRGFHEFIN